MAAIAFDTLKFARRLKEAGVPEAQAEVQAELMAEAFVFNMDALVTRDYLEQCLDSRFATQGARFDSRFATQGARFDSRFVTQGERFDARLANHDLQFSDIRGELKLHRWILAMIAASTVIPALQQLYALLIS